MVNRTAIFFSALIILAFAGCNEKKPESLEKPESLYNESYRPQFHFTYEKGWLSDINGLVYYDGEYHFFSQHCPDGPELTYPNTFWGHAVSTDLVTWNELPPALEPDALGPIFSGSAVVDWNNTSGFKTGEEEVLVAFYTGAGYILDENKDGVMCMAYSNDRGRSWTKYEDNPLFDAVTHLNRDPKVFWHEKSKKWIMLITISCGGFYEGDYEFAMFSSPDMKSWKEISRFEMPRGIDCPDMFELEVDGDPKNKMWVVWAGDGTHAFGDFDGENFEFKDKVQLPLVDWFEDGANGYAAQTFNDIPESDGRRIQISWMQHGNYPGMPFNQQATIPCELTLRTTNEGIRLYRYPIEEIGKLHGKKWTFNERILSNENILTDVSGEFFDIQAEIDPGTSYNITFLVRETKITYDPLRKTLSCNGKSISAVSHDGLFRLRLLIDRTSLEIFADNGRTSLTFSLPPSNKEFPLELSAMGGVAKIKTLKVWEMKSMHNFNNQRVS